MALKLNLNEPAQIAITRADAKEFTHPGKASSFMYSIVLPDGREDKLFLTPSGVQTLQQLQIQPREWFSICRRKTPQGIEFFDLQTSAIAGRHVSSSIGAPAPSPSPKPIPPQRATSSNSASSVMGAALMAAIDAVKEAEEYAKRKGIPVEFGPADLRAIANTIYIAATKDPLFGERVA